ncbi:hypothetical protein A2Y83_00535 [Candidatus Falkowbacteria bacterium RBG_13_39_14]|uniref:Calcineurin-like phosphoesterase domain-containing protein n=1 Tax=Candidatus Falkowbacteria bacterium RBG_13_39_14 TaxID=1797985 RepID=A0A1F5S209_9BACT|nr:MAG: hypothetical protein A2Y83_00535 [Candidatus Falkowbacteria bacterium RBG_13_39_14]
MQIIIFLIFALGIVFGAHFFLTFSVIKFFSISSRNIKIILTLLAILLPLAFLAALILARWKDNFFTRAFYAGAAGWFGVLVNLLIACVIVWAVTSPLPPPQRRGDYRIIAAIFLIAALIYSGYGFYNAQNPQIKNLTVKIKKLPENWKNKKIVHIADVHPGHINRANFLKKIVNKINQVEPDAVYGLYTDGDFNLYTTNGAGTWGPPMRTGNTPEIVVIEQE